MNQKEMENEILDVMLKEFVKNYIGQIGEVGNSPLMKNIEKTMFLGGDMTKAEGRRMDRAVTALVLRLSKDPHYEFNVIRSESMLRRYR